MFDPAIDDLRGMHARAYRIECTLDFGQHPAMDDPFLDCLLYTSDAADE